MSDDPPFLSRIRSRLPDLHRAERKLGAFLLEFPGDLASYDAQELARLSGVSKATVSRFVRRIGYASYDAARRAARDESQIASRHYLAHAETIPHANLLAACIQESQDNIAWTFQQIDPATLDALADAILGARKVWLIGYRISRVFADYMYWQLLKVVDECAAIPGPGESLGEHLAAIRPGDLVICVALRRRSANTAQTLAELAELGVPVALITDEGAAPVATARWHYRCRTQISGPHFDHASVAALCRQIVTSATLKAGPAARARLRQVDEINERLGDV